MLNRETRISGAGEKCAPVWDWYSSESTYGPGKEWSGL